MMTPFDALIDAIIAYSGYHIPGSQTHRSRNPGGLRAYSPTVERDAEGHRVFKSDIDGLQALKFDVRLKISGKAKRKCSTLGELATAYDKKPTQATAWAGFIKRALNDNTVSPRTPITFFTEQK